MNNDGSEGTKNFGQRKPNNHVGNLPIAYSSVSNSVGRHIDFCTHKKPTFSLE